MCGVVHDFYIQHGGQATEALGAGLVSRIVAKDELHDAAFAVAKAIAARPYGEEQTAQTWADVDPSLPESAWLPIVKQAAIHGMMDMIRADLR